MSPIMNDTDLTHQVRGQSDQQFVCKCTESAAPISRFSVPLPWPFLAQHELQQGPDRLNCKSETLFIFGTACQIYCYGRYCVRRSVSPQVPENPSGPLVDNFIVLPCVAFGVTCVKLLPGVDRWNSLDEPRVIGPCHCEVWGWPRH